jgi:transcriptional regulator with XRE-family HTH domain
VVKVDIQKRFGRSVRSLRKRQAISQEELAGRAGLHRTYVCDIERGARNVSLKSIEKLANALGVPTSALFEEREEFPSEEPQTQVA